MTVGCSTAQQVYQSLPPTVQQNSPVQQSPANCPAPSGSPFQQIVPVLQNLIQTLTNVVQQLSTSPAQSCGCGGAAGAAAGATTTGGGGKPAASTGTAASGGGPSGQTAEQYIAAASGTTPAAQAAKKKSDEDAKKKADAAAAAAAAKPKIAADAPVLMIGDSLGVGIDGGLKTNLAGHAVTVNAKVSRHLSEGMAIYDQSAKPAVVAMGLGTNDSPTNINALRDAIQKTINDAKARKGRVIWSTIHRAPVGGKSYDEINAMIRKFAADNPDVMKVVDWEDAVTKNPGFLAGDKIHGTGAGYAWRAQAYADAAK